MLALTVLDQGRVRFTLPDGRHCWLTVTEICRGKVRIGLDFVKEITISREELLHEKDRYVNTIRHDGRPKGRDDRQAEAQAPDPEFGVFIDRLDPP